MRRKAAQRGTAAIEFAVAAPVLMIVLFAFFEFGRAYLIRNTVMNATYEAARRGIVPGATASDIRNEALMLLDSAAIRSAVISVDPDTITSSTDEVTVDIRVPMDSNSWFGPRFFTGRWVEASCTLAREKYGAP